MWYLAHTMQRRPLFGRGAFAVLFVVVGVMAIYRPVLWGRVLTIRDLSQWVMPARVLVRDSWSHGAPPVWNPWEGLGFPFSADPLFGPFYLPSLITLPLPLAWGTSFFFVTHILLGSLGLYALSRRFGCAPPAAVVGGLAWGLAGIVGSEIPTGVRLITAAWIPLACVSSHLLVTSARDGERATLPAVSLGLCAAMMLLTGEVFVTLMAGFPILACCASVWFSPDRPASRVTASKAITTALVGLVTAAIIALLVSAPSWLPAVRLVGATSRSHALKPSDLNGWALHPYYLLDLFIPSGVLDVAVRTNSHALVSLLGSHVFLVSIYVGASVLGLISLAPRRASGAVPYIIVTTAVFGVLLSLGGHTPVLAATRWLLRPFDYMRSPMKFLLIAHPMFALAAALGAERVRDATAPYLRLVVVALSVFLAAWLIARAGGPMIAPVVTVGTVGVVIRLALLAVFITALRYGPKKLRESRLTPWFLPLIVLLDLGTHSERIAEWERPPPTENPPLASIAQRFGATTDRGASPPRLWRSSALDTDVLHRAMTEATRRTRETLRPKRNVTAWVTVVNGYDVAVSEAVDRLVSSDRVAALRLLSVDLALTLSSRAPNGTHDLNITVDRAHLFALNAPLPRAFVAYASRLDEPRRLSHLLEEDILRGERVALAASDLHWLPSHTPTQRSRCAVTHWSPGDVTLDCAADASGMAVLVEQFAPGWHATVDGRGSVIVQVNRVALGVPVTSGRHAVRFRYLTPGRSLGTLLAALGVVLCAALALVGRGRRLTHSDPGA